MNIFSYVLGQAGQSVRLNLLRASADGRRGSNSAVVLNQDWCPRGRVAIGDAASQTRHQKLRGAQDSKGFSDSHVHDATQVARRHFTE